MTTQPAIGQIVHIVHPVWGCIPAITTLITPSDNQSIHATKFVPNETPEPTIAAHHKRSPGDPYPPVGTWHSADAHD